MMFRRSLKKIYSAMPAKRPMFELLRPLHLPKVVYQHLHFAGPFTVKMDGRPLFRMIANNEIVENDLFWAGLGGNWDAMSLRLWCELARSASGILDIGANTGAYSLAAQAANPDAKIVAFEPVKRIADRLRQNIDLNGFKVEIEQRAASDRAGTATLFDARTHMNYTASLEEAHGQHDHSYVVETVTVDQFMQDHGWPEVGLVKIDVEMHEPAVIRGMLQTIGRFRPIIFVEVLHSEQGQEIATQFRDQDYAMFNIDEENRRVIPTDKLRHLHGESWNNLLCPCENRTVITTLGKSVA